MQIAAALLLPNTEKYLAKWIIFSEDNVVNLIFFFFFFAFYKSDTHEQESLPGTEAGGKFKLQTNPLSHLMISDLMKKDKLVW